MSSLKEHEQERDDDLDDYQNNTFSSSNGCNCFGFPCFKWQRNEHKHISHHNEGQEEEYREIRESWLIKKLKKAKEISELHAGPKWKTFIRKLGGYCNMKNTKRHKTNNFQYDPQSYALNFDEGLDREDRPLV